MTLAMKKTDAYASLHAKLVQEVRSEPVEPVEDVTAGQHIHCLLSAAVGVCALPKAMFADDDITDIRNVRTILARLIERIEA